MKFCSFDLKLLEVGFLPIILVLGNMQKIMSTKIYQLNLSRVLQVKLYINNGFKSSVMYSNLYWKILVTMQAARRNPNLYQQSHQVQKVSLIEVLLQTLSLEQ